MSKESVFRVNWDNAIDPRKTAYVLTHVEGRGDDDQRLAGLRYPNRSLSLSQQPSYTIA